MVRVEEVQGVGFRVVLVSGLGSLGFKGLGFRVVLA